MFMQGKPKKILVVEDDPDILEFLQVLFAQEGYIVAIADQPEDVENLHDGSLPDLILIDVSLSGKDGRDIVKHLKSQTETSSIPIIMFSAYLHAEETALAAGADDFVAKPFEVEELLEKIARHF
jgi:DNA-binding response OmpR family regulator